MGMISYIVNPITHMLSSINLLITGVCLTFHSLKTHDILQLLLHEMSLEIELCENILLASSSKSNSVPSPYFRFDEAHNKPTQRAVVRMALVCKVLQQCQVHKKSYINTKH